jgi:hypothetical protein
LCYKPSQQNQVHKHQCIEKNGKILKTFTGVSGFVHRPAVSYLETNRQTDRRTKLQSQETNRHKEKMGKAKLMCVSRVGNAIKYKRTPSYEHNMSFDMCLCVQHSLSLIFL